MLQFDKVVEKNEVFVKKARNLWNTLSGPNKIFIQLFKISLSIFTKTVQWFILIKNVNLWGGGSEVEFCQFCFNFKKKI